MEKRMNKNEIETKAVEMIASALVGWTFNWNRRVRTNGVCNYSKKTIFLSIYNVNRADADVLNTLVHEIAHALTEGEHHSSVWKSKFLSLGGNGSILGSSANVPFTWVMEYKGTLVKGFYRKPTVAIRKLSSTFITGRPETKGLLTIRKV
jgi:hypothetical protein